MAELFRPRQLNDVIGQDTVKNLIRRSLRNKSFPKFSLMCGQSGTGKSTVAEICGLALTCENPENGEPCCKCKNCVDNLQQLNNGKSSMNLMKINMGAIERTDFKQTIKEIFTLKPVTGGNAVYIFEEIQALTKSDQNILLEYISNIQDNIYIIACTTEMSKLRSELKNRAIKFQFKSFSTSDAMKLLDITCTRKQIKKPAENIARFLVRSVDNCPREIVNLISFLADSDTLNNDDITNFLGFVSNDKYIEYFKRCSGDTYQFVEWLDTLTEVGYINIVRGLRDFLIDSYQYVYGSNKALFNTHEKHDLMETFENVSEDKMHKLMMYFNDCRCDSDTSAKYSLIHGRMLFREETVAAVMNRSRHDADYTTLKSENKAHTVDNREEKNMKVDESSLKNILDGLQKIKS